MKFKEVNPSAISPINPPDSGKVARLATSMRKDGWIGRPLLVEETDARYAAWTGSNRLVAAVEAALPLVPCMVITRTEADAAFLAAGLRNDDGYLSWRDVATAKIGRRDEARLGTLMRAGLRVAAEMLLEEIRSEEG